MDKNFKSITGFSPVHPEAAHECHDGLSSVVCFPLSGCTHCLRIKKTIEKNILTVSMRLNRKHMKDELCVTLLSL